ncbi:MAG: alkaline shock response membrane anchor protein AmaP [Actinobacteria bacterium]|nr:alkaline shock response membrane anchor protein AmaP [Actinomycetota bacterium]
MNIFNKIIVVIILLFFIFISFLSIINEFIGFFSWTDIANKVFNPKTNINPYVSILALLMVIVICVFLLLLEFHRRRTKIAKIYNVESGKAMITLSTISQQIKDSVMKVKGLQNVRINILPKQSGIIINLMVELSQNLNIPEKMTEIINVARDVSLNKLNIKVIDTNLTITNLVIEDSKEEKTGNNIYGSNYAVQKSEIAKETDKNSEPTSNVPS